MPPDPDSEETLPSGDPLITRVGLLGDIHGRLDRLKTALERFDAEAIDDVLSVGDIVDGPRDGTGDVPGCIDLLLKRGVRCIRGNHEAMLFMDGLTPIPGWTRRDELDDRQLDFLRGLPPMRFFNTPMGRLALCHGLAWDDFTFVHPDTSLNAIRPTTEFQWLLRAGVDVHLCGHTHHRMVRRLESLLFINVGALGTERSQPCHAVLDLEAGRLRFEFFDGSPAETHDLERIEMERS
jgi:predicted phosphodiesterase